MAKKRKVPEKTNYAALAAASAFNELKDLECVNLTGGKRVVDVLSSGSLVLDLILGGGFARGRIGSIWGPEASGKSTLIQQLIVSAQIAQIPIVLYDFEGGADPVYMRTQGVDFKYKLRVKVKVDKKLKQKTIPGLFYAQPYTGESAYRHILRTLSHMNEVDSGPPTILFLIDSFAAMPSEETDPNTGEGGRLGSESRMHSEHLRQISAKLRRKGGILIGTNQVRTNIGQSYGNPQQQAGGNALKFYTDYQLKVTKQWKEGAKPGGIVEDALKVNTLPVLWRTLKNKAFSPFKSTEMRLILGRGLDFAFDTKYFFKAQGLFSAPGGRNKINFGKLAEKSYSWKEFRRLCDNPAFRQQCFSLLQKGDTYARYFKAAEDATYSYDADYDYTEEDSENMRKLVLDEADEYRERKKKRRAAGKKAPNGAPSDDEFEIQTLEEEAE